MKALLILVFFACSLQAVGQNYNWPAYNITTIPDSIASEDAVYLENVTTIDFKQHNETSVVSFKRIKLLTKKGVEAFSEREIYQFNEGYIAMKKARVIKPSGQIIELEGENIKETFIEEKQNREKFYLKRIQLLFPNLEIGDVIDVVYQVDYSFYLLSNTIFLEDDLISINSRLSLRNFSTFELSIYPTSGMNDFTSTNQGDYPTFSWNKKNVRKITESDYSCPSPTSSKVMYMLWYPGQSFTFNEVYSMDSESHLKRMSGGSINRPIMNAGIVLDNPMMGLMDLMAYLQKDFAWVSESEVSNNVKTIDYFEKKKINNSLYFRYIQLYLTENKLNFKVGYTRSLLDGVFEPAIVTTDQLTHRFLIIYDQQENPHYLFGPKSESKFYYLDEIPYYCEGNNAVTLAGDEGKLETISTAILPTGTLNDNKHTSNLLIKLSSTNSDSLNAKRTDVFSGHYSYLLRGKSQQVWLENFAVADTSLIPTESSLVYPYNESYKQDIVLTDLLTELEDSLYWFKPESVLPVGIYSDNESIDAIADFAILPFLKQDKYSIYLECNGPVNLAETVKPYIFSNEIGSIKLEALQSNTSTIKFVYELKLSQRVLDSHDKNKAFQELQKEWNNVRTKKWVIKH